MPIALFGLYQVVFGETVVPLYYLLFNHFHSSSSIFNLANFVQFVTLCVDIVYSFRFLSLLDLLDFDAVLASYYLLLQNIQRGSWSY